MHKVEVATAYLISKYGNSGSLDKAKVSKVLYLADWETFALNAEPVTACHWRKISCGPTSLELNRAVEKGPYLGLVLSAKAPSDPQFSRVVVKQTPPMEALTVLDVRILDVLWNFCESQPWSNFLRYIGNTYPMIRASLNEEMDLPEMYRLYKNESVIKLSEPAKAVPA